MSRNHLVCLLALSATVGVSAQGSPDYLVHHAFDPLVGGVYQNYGSTGTVNDGTPLGNVTMLIPSAIGIGVSLGGAAGDEIDAGPSPLAGAQERTVSVWARTSAASGIVTPLTFGTNGNGSKWDMDIDVASGGVFELGVGGGRTTGQGANGLNDGQWHLLTAVLPTGGLALGDVRLFVDGVFASTGSGTRAINTGTGNVFVGRSANFPATIQFFPGDVDDAVIWSVPFTDAQVKSLYDTAMHPSLGYSAGEFEQLLEVYRQNQPEVTIGGRVWQQTTGLTGPAGLTTPPNGRFELVFDPATGAGLHVVFPSRTASFGVGCPGTGGLTPSISTSGVPMIGTIFSVDVSDALANSFALVLFAWSRNDLAMGNGCTAYPRLPGFTSLVPVSATGTASMPLFLPPSQVLLGMRLHAQWGVLDPAGAFGPNVASFSDALVATIGDI